MKVKSLSRVRLLVTPWTAAYEAPWDFPGKSTGVGCHCLLLEQSGRWKFRVHSSLFPSPSSLTVFSSMQRCCIILLIEHIHYSNSDPSLARDGHGGLQMTVESDAGNGGSSSQGSLCWEDMPVLPRGRESPLAPWGINTVYRFIVFS